MRRFRSRARRPLGSVSRDSGQKKEKCALRYRLKEKGLITYVRWPHLKWLYDKRLHCIGVRLNLTERLITTVILITVVTGKCRDRTLLRGAIAKFKLQLRDILEANRSDNSKRIDPSSRIFVFFRFLCFYFIDTLLLSLFFLNLYIALCTTNRRTMLSYAVYQ